GYRPGPGGARPVQACGARACGRKRRPGATAARVGVVVAQPLSAGALAEHAAAMRAAGRRGRVNGGFRRASMPIRRKRLVGCDPALQHIHRVLPAAPVCAANPNASGNRGVPGLSTLPWPHAMATDDQPPLFTALGHELSRGESSPGFWRAQVSGWLILAVIGFGIRLAIFGDAVAAFW